MGRRAPRWRGALACVPVAPLQPCGRAARAGQRHAAVAARQRNEPRRIGRCRDGVTCRASRRLERSNGSSQSRGTGAAGCATTPTPANSRVRCRRQRPPPHMDAPAPDRVASSATASGPRQRRRWRHRLADCATARGGIHRRVPEARLACSIRCAGVRRAADLLSRCAHVVAHLRDLVLDLPDVLAVLGVGVAMVPPRVSVWRRGAPGL